MTTAAISSQIIGKRYLLHERLGAGGMGTVYRATDRLTRNIVALKRVTAAPEDLAFASKADSSTNLRLALAAEFRTLSSLRHPHIISVLDYGFDEARQPYFTMEYLVGSDTITATGQYGSVQDKVGLIIQMLQALVYLHRRGVIHRDLKPGNVLVMSGQVKVVDFGLSVTATTPSGKHRTESTAGTFAYMAPELFQGAPVSQSADLYAVGVMAYELLAGRHPFNVGNIALLVNEILNKPADVWSIGLDYDLAGVLERLLVKEAEQRYTDAAEVIRALCEAVKLPLPSETVAIRESFLQAAKFVARDTELSQLTNALNRALDRQGSAWLVGGESGVGKSRLLDELRALALVKGALVLRGQAVNEGGSPYQLWRDVLRFLCLLSDLDDNEAGVLKAVIPGIDALLGRDIPDAPPLDPQATQNRLIAVVMTVFRRQKQPLMVILEDLQWAGSESVAPLNSLNVIVADLPVLVLGSYRDDERSDLPSVLPGMQTLRLKRLVETGIAELSASMLGAAGRDPQLVSLLQRETEGNIFFLVEVVRALAEEAGQLDHIGVMTLPRKVFAGGIQTVVQRRLSRVPEAGRGLLQIAAVAGRELDLDVLRVVDPAVNLETWMTTCVSAAVLDIQENRWRFTHDKLREGVLADIPERELSVLHRRVGEAIEVTYPDTPERAAALAHHFAAAGENAKAVIYSRQAAQRAEAVYAYKEAVHHLQTALQLLEDSGQIETRQEVLEQLADVDVLMGERSQAIPTYQAALDLWQKSHSAESMVALRLHRKIVEAITGLPQYTDIQRFEVALQTSINAGLQLIQNKPPHAETVRLLTALTHEAYLARFAPDWEAAEDYARAAVNMGEQLGVLVELSASLGALASVYGARGLWRERVQVAIRRLALSRDPRFGNLREHADILNQAGEALLRVGEYAQALPYLFEAEKLGDQIRVVDVQWYSLGLQGECWFGLDRWDELLKVEEKWQILTQRYAHEQIGRLCFNMALRAATVALRGGLEQSRVLREDAYNYMAVLNGGPPEIWGRGALY